SIRLLRIKNVPADRPRRQVGQLQAGRVDLLSGEDDLKREGLTGVVHAVTNPPKLEFQFVIFFSAARFENDMGDAAWRFLLAKVLFNAFQSKTHREIVRIS